MKILHVLDHSVPLHSGYTFRSQNIFTAQLQRGWTPVVVTSPKHEESWKGPTVPREEYGGVPYFRSGRLEPVAPVVDELRLMARTLKTILRVAGHEKPELIHAHSPVLNAFPALRAGRRLGLPVVYEIRAFWEDAAVDQRTTTEGSARYRLTRQLETWACQMADHVAVICQGLRNDLISRGIPAEKISVVYNGINPDDFKPTPPDAEYLREWGLEGKTVVGFIGSFYRYEGLDLLIRAFGRIAAQVPQAVLLLVGGGEMDKELRAQAQAMGLADRVIMPGRVPHARVPGVYSMVDVLAYPRYRMRLTDLVTPLKPLEAMAMGKALVGSDVGGNKELVRHGETGLLFPAGDEAALAEALLRALTDKELLSIVQAKGPEYVREHHTWERTTAVHRHMYERAFASRGMPRVVTEGK